MNLYSNMLLFNLLKEDKFQSNDVNEFLLRHMFPQKKEKKIFHIDCPYTKKKVCYCKYDEASLMPKQEKVFYESIVEFLEDEYKGRDKKYAKEIYDRRTFLKEKYKNIQEPEDIHFYANYFEEAKGTKTTAPAEESSPNKRIQTDTNSYVTVKPNGPTFNNQDMLRRKKPETNGYELSTRGARKNYNENNDEELEAICHFEHCGKDSNPEDFLACGKCRKTFHAKCCSPPLNKKIVERYPWFCNECKLCFVCKSNVDENKMIICDICDRAFHSDCLTPKLTSIPQGDWYCNECKKCKSCSSLLNKEPNFPNLEKNLWENDYFLCGPCLQHFQNNEYCPVCLSIIDEEEEGNYVCCDNCNLWVHAECDGMSDKQFKATNHANYTCPICRSRK